MMARYDRMIGGGLDSGSPTPPFYTRGTQKTPEWRRRAQLVRAAAMAVYWLYDNTCFFIMIKLSSYDPVKALTRDGAAWYVLE